MKELGEVMISISTCSDFACEWDGEGEHTHVGVRPYLRRVINPEGKLIDGKTEKEPVKEPE